MGSLVYLEFVLISLAAFAGAALLLRPADSPLLARAIFAIGMLASVGWIAVQRASWRPPGPPPGPLQYREAQADAPGGFVSSNACRACHPNEYRTWHRSFHRTMTQRVSAQTVLGDFNDLQLWFDGRRYDLSRQGGQFWVELPEPDQVDKVLSLVQQGQVEAAQSLAQGIPRVRRQILYSTGSHHYQLYWYGDGRGRELYMLPFVWLISERRWLPRVSVFLIPPNQVEPRKVWNKDCLPCHSTAGQPRYGQDGPGPDTLLAEAGIACEACHGPGQRHIAANRNPLRRYELHLSGKPDPTEVQPERLDAVRAGEVCGQCHSVNTYFTPQQWKESLRGGNTFRAGDRLEDHLYVVRTSTLSKSPLMEQFVKERPGVLAEWFWPDGEMRVVGREYNGLAESPCFRGGKFSCLSCHSLHQSDPDDQLKAGMEGDRACIQCHEKYAAKLEQHTHHKAASSGSRCYNCHMPHTTYGLLKASRSHKVTSPSIAAEVKTGRPNACNLCHLDKSLAWTDRYLGEWYKSPPAKFDPGSGEYAAAPGWLLSGDAGVRAIAAWHMGWKPAVEASGNEWLAPFLAQSLRDPYDVVRYIGSRSLRRLPGFSNFAYDFISPPAEAQTAAARGIDQWTESAPNPLQRPDGFVRPTGGLDTAAIGRFLRQRDERPVYLVE